MKKVLLGVVALILVPIFAVVVLLGAPEDKKAAVASAGGVGEGLNAAGIIPKDYIPVLEKAGKTCSEVPAPVLAGQTMAESHFEDHPANSAGAEGPSQFIPSTWATWGKDYDGDGKADVHNFKDSVPSQAALMCDFVKQVKAGIKAGKIKGDVLTLALDSYNCGYKCVTDAGGIPQNAQTKAYAPTILKWAQKFSSGVPANIPKGMLGDVIKAAMSQKGKHYILGQGGPGKDQWDTYDCSGLVSWAFWKGSKGKISLPHKALMIRQDKDLQSISDSHDVSKLQPGDILTFNIPTDPGPWGHVAIYIGGGKIVESSDGTVRLATPGGGVGITDITKGYYQTVPWHAGRVHAAA